MGFVVLLVAHFQEKWGDVRKDQQAASSSRNESFLLHGWMNNSSKITLFR